MMNNKFVVEPDPIKQRNLASLAAEVMAERRWTKPDKRRVKVTGRVAGRRRRVGSLVQLPDGRVAELKAALRGRAVVAWTDLRRVDPFCLAVCNVDEITPFKLPAARSLGTMKRGKKERPSLRKLRACRRNGRKPCRPGKKRGRPKTRPT